MIIRGIYYICSAWFLDIIISTFFLCYLPSYELNICCTVGDVSHVQCPGCQCLYRYYITTEASFQPLGKIILSIGDSQHNIE